MDWSEGSSYGPNNLSCVGFLSMLPFAFHVLVTSLFSLSFEQVTKFEEDGILMADMLARIQA